MCGAAQKETYVWSLFTYIYAHTSMHIHLCTYIFTPKVCTWIAICRRGLYVWCGVAEQQTYVWSLFTYTYTHTSSHQCMYVSRDQQTRPICVVLLKKRRMYGLYSHASMHIYSHVHRAARNASWNIEGVEPGSGRTWLIGPGAVLVLIKSNT